MLFLLLKIIICQPLCIHVYITLYYLNRLMINTHDRVLNDFDAHEENESIDALH